MACSMADSAVPALAPSGPAACTARLATCAHLPQSRETIAVPAMPSTRAAPVDRSMHRPFTNGPRSFIRTVTLRPVECEVTVT